MRWIVFALAAIAIACGHIAPAPAPIAKPPAPVVVTPPAPPLPLDDVVAASLKVLHDGRGGELHAALARRDQRFAELGRRITGSPVIASCAADAAFTAAMDKVVGGSP